MHGNAAWQNYLFWLSDRGLRFPTPILKTVLFLIEGPLSAEETALLERMIKAMGLDEGNVTRRIVNVQDTPSRLSTIVDSSPNGFIVIMGSILGDILLGPGKPRGRYGRIRGTAALNTHHPRELISQVSLKREAWCDLQVVMSILGLRVLQTATGG